MGIFCTIQSAILIDEVCSLEIIRMQLCAYVHEVTLQIFLSK